MGNKELKKETEREEGSEKKRGENILISSFSISEDFGKGECWPGQPLKD